MAAAAAAAAKSLQLCLTQTAAHQAPRPWDSPGKNTGVGCHFLLQNQGHLLPNLKKLTEFIYKF